MNETTSRRQSFIINILYFALVAALIILALRYLVPWLLPFIIGYVIAMIFKPVVRFLTGRLKVGPKLAGFIVVILAYALIVLLLVLGGARLVAAGRGLFYALPSFYEQSLQPALTVVGNFLNNTFGGILPGLNNASDQAPAFNFDGFQGALLTLSTTALNFLGNLGARLPGFVLAFFFTIISSLLISMNYDQVTDFLSRQIPEKHRELVGKIKGDAIKTMGNYFIALLKIMSITFAGLTVGLMVLGVSSAPLIALGIAVFDMFPVVGVGGIIIPWALFNLLTGNYPMALGLAVLYGIVTVVRGFIEPKIVGRQLGLHPLVTLSAMYAGFKVIGVMGMVVFPIAAQILVSLHHSEVLTLWRRDEDLNKEPPVD